MPDFLAQILGQFKKIWGDLTGAQRTTIIAVVLGLFGLMGGLAWYGSQPDLVPLASDLSQEDLTKVQSALQEKGIEGVYRGNTILVPRSIRSELVMTLAIKGVGRSGQGWDLLDKVSPTAPRILFSHKVIQARCVEAANAIRSINGVQNATVNAVVPKRTIYSATSKENRAKAYVVVHMRPGVSVKPYLPGIANLVSSAFERLEPENVHIVDGLTGKPYTSNTGTDDLFASGVEFRKNQTDYYERKAQDFLDRSFGMGKTVVMVHLEMDLTSKEEKVLAPDKDSKVVLNKRVTESSSSGGGSSGRVNTKDVTAGGGSSGSGTSKSESEKEETYDYKRTETLTRDPGGRITKITAAVQIDESLKDKIDPVKKLVATALGLQYTKDMTEITVEALPFSKPEEVVEVGPPGFPMEKWIGHGVQILGAFIVLFFLKGLLKKGGKSSPVMPSSQAEEEAEGEEKKDDPTKERKRYRKEIERSVAADPGAVGRLLAGWLQEK